MKRYELESGYDRNTGQDVFPIEFSDGVWVYYEDAQAEIDRLREDLKYTKQREDDCYKDAAEECERLRQRVAEIEKELHEPVIESEWQELQRKYNERGEAMKKMRRAMKHVSYNPRMSVWDAFCHDNKDADEWFKDLEE